MKEIFFFIFFSRASPCTITIIVATCFYFSLYIISSCLFVLPAFYSQTGRTALFNQPFFRGRVIPNLIREQYSNIRFIIFREGRNKKSKKTSLIDGNWLCSFDLPCLVSFLFRRPINNVVLQLDDDGWPWLLLSLSLKAPSVPSKEYCLTISRVASSGSNRW